MNNRILQFLSAENISQAQFADNIGVTRASISHILSGRNKPGYDFIVNTMKRYPNLNIEWLLTGRGKMYKESERKTPDYKLFDNETPTIGESFSDGRSQDTDAQTVVSLSSYDSVEGKEIAQETNRESDIKTTIVSNSRDNQAKEIVTQRNVIKVVLFFDDSTFQEF